MPKMKIPKGNFQNRQLSKSCRPKSGPGRGREAITIVDLIKRVRLVSVSLNFEACASSYAPKQTPTLYFFFEVNMSTPDTAIN